jgi:hypothetical protein
LTKDKIKIKIFGKMEYFQHSQFNDINKKCSICFLVIEIEDSFGEKVKQAWKRIYELEGKRTKQTDLHQWGRKRKPHK